MNKQKFVNKTILITGASSGLGKEFVKKLAVVDAKLILVARRRDRLEELKKELSHEKAEIFIISLDLSTNDGPRTVFDSVKNLSLTVDILINNAGFSFSDEFLDDNLSDYMNMIDLNIKAIIQLIYLFLPEMKSRKSGSILNVSSILGALPFPDLTVYSGTKAFVLTFSEALWKELKRYNISVTALVSVGIETEFYTKVHREKFRYLPMQKADKVAEKALTGLAKKKRIAYTANRYAFLLHSKRILPQRLIIWMNDLFYDSKKSKS